MQEMLFVGQGGQGVVLASQILAETFARAGSYVQSFPEFKAERRGAPIAAFLRRGDVPIHRRYKVRAADVLVGIAPPSPQQLASVRPGGLVLLDRETRWPFAAPFRVARVPASRIARDHGVLSSEGRPMANTAILGACVRLLLPDGLPFLEEALAARLRGSAREPNLVAAREGYARCTVQHHRADDLPLAPPPPAARPHAELAFASSTTDSLANHTGSWSLDRPVIAEACNACGICVLFCPEGAVTREDGAIVVDYLYCKGCGICDTVCPVRGALAMEEVVA